MSSDSESSYSEYSDEDQRQRENKDQDNRGYRETEFGEKGARERSDDTDYRRDRYEERYRETGYRDQQVMRRDVFGRGSGAMCCFLLVVLIIGAVSFAGLVLSMIEFIRDAHFDNDSPVKVVDNRPIPTEQPNDHYPEDEYAYTPGPYMADEVWLIHIDVDGSTFEYFDRVQGTLKGYNIDIVNAVCRKANKNCRIVFDSYSRCWSGGLGAEGLMSGWYHACTGWRITTDRTLVYKFTHPFQKPSGSVLVTSSGSSGGQYDVSGKKIGFVQGFSNNMACLNQQDDKVQGLPLNSDQEVIFPTIEALKAGLTSGQVDAVLIGSEADFVAQNFIVSEEIFCSLEGGAMMMRKDTPLDKWWNPAWKALLASQEYEDICNDIQRVHGDRGGLKSEMICRDPSIDFPQHAYKP